MPHLQGEIESSPGRVYIRQRQSGRGRKADAFAFRNDCALGEVVRVLVDTSLIFEGQDSISS